jgi:hypothetical protein
VAGSVAELVECLLSKHKAQSSNPHTPKKKARKKMYQMLFGVVSSEMLR